MKRFLPHIIAACLFLALLLSKFDPSYGFSELAGFGEDYHLPQLDVLQDLAVYHKPNSTGYDGQFYTQIALDPTLSDPLLAEAIDHPSYRSRRILVPALSYLVGFGQAAAILQAHSLINVACLAACALLLLHWIPAGTWPNFARWACCVFSMGALESVRYSLADLPSLTLALATITLLDKSRGRLATLAHTLTVLSKETALINAALFLSPGKTNPRKPSRRILDATIAGTIAAAVLGTWMLYVSSVFPLTVNSASNIGIPFAGLYRGIVDAIQQLQEGQPLDRYLFRIIAIAGLLFQFAYLLAKPQPKSRIWLLGILYGILFLTLGDAVWRGYWAGCRIALPLTFAFNILLSDRHKPSFWTVLALTNLSLVHAIVRWL